MIINFVLVENREKAGNVGAIDVVVKTINAHIDNADVCEKGCGALNNMVLNCKKKKASKKKW